MKKCPFCAEEIQEEAIKCRYCGEFLAKKEEKSWYFKTSTLVLAVLFVGPLSLPLVWFNPRFSRNKKLIISLMIIVLTYVLGVLVMRSVKSLNEYYQLIFQY